MVKAKRLTDIADVARLLEEAIADGTLQPNERLVEYDIARRFNTSRAVVRMAMQRLEQMRLIVRERNRGARVRSVSEQEAVEIMLARAAIESIVVRQAAELLTDDEIAHLRALLEEMKDANAAHDVETFGDLVAALHALLLEVSRNGTAAALLSYLNSQVLRVQFRTLYQPGRMARSLEEHSNLVDAFAGRNTEAACAAHRRHMENSLSSLEQALAVRQKRLQKTRLLDDKALSTKRRRTRDQHA